MSKASSARTVADFFAGIGLVSMGLDQAGWKTTYAIDYDPLKELQYTTNFGKKHYRLKDISTETGKNIPDVTLAHASFPCTDLSLAGSRKGIHQGESSAFWEFARILSEMKQEYGETSPNIVLLENVEGLLNSNDGADLNAVLTKLNNLGYRVDLLRIDASHFVPQSRVRIFIVGIHRDLIGEKDESSELQEYSIGSSDARPPKIISYINKHSEIDWYFQRLPNLPIRTIAFKDIVDTNEKWWEEERTENLYNQLHERQKVILEKLMQESKYSYLPGFRRMRVREGKKQPTIELRNDGIAGCLRTPKGGSARQIIVRVGKGTLNARLINGVEAARLMGAQNFKIHPDLSLNQTLFGFGDAVCVSVLEWLGINYFNPLLDVLHLREPAMAQLNTLNQVPVLGFQD